MKIKNLKNKSLKGFTLIELLVVITIIGILATIVVVNLNTARGRGQDTAIKEQMSQLRAAAALYYDTSFGYTTGAVASAVTNAACITAGGGVGASIPAGSFFADSDVIRSMVQLNRNAADIPQCSWGTGAATSQTWVITSKMRVGGKFFCVDSMGSALEITSRSITASGSGDVTCPTS